MLGGQFVPGSPVWDLVLPPDVKESAMETACVEMVELFDVKPAPRVSIV